MIVLYECCLSFQYHFTPDQTHLTLLLSSSPISLSVLKLTSCSLVVTETSSVLIIAVGGNESLSVRQLRFHCPVEPVGSLSESAIPSMYLSELRVCGRGRAGRDSVGSEAGVFEEGS